MLYNMLYPCKPSVINLARTGLDRYIALFVCYVTCNITCYIRCYVICYIIMT